MNLLSPVIAFFVTVLMAAFIIGLAICVLALQAAVSCMRGRLMLIPDRRWQDRDRVAA